MVTLRPAVPLHGTTRLHSHGRRRRRPQRQCRPRRRPRHFTTAAGADLRAPTITSNDADPGEPTSAPTPWSQVRFSERINPFTVTATTSACDEQHIPGPWYAGTLDRHQRSLSAAFTPIDAACRRSRSYDYTFNGITDLAGGYGMAADVEHFTTGGVDTTGAGGGGGEPAERGERGAGERAGGAALSEPMTAVSERRGPVTMTARRARRWRARQC